MRVEAGTKAEERWRLLNLRHLPARLDTEEAGWLLGFNVDEMSILIQRKLLSPLGDPAPNGRKFFSRAKMQSLGNDPSWLDKASRTIIGHWRARNTKPK